MIDTSRLNDVREEYKLKACPFCGEKAEMIRTRDYGMTVFTVHCTNKRCCLYFGVAPDIEPEKLAKEWNTRR